MRRAMACGACVVLLWANFVSAKAEDKGQNSGSLIGKKVIAIRPDVVLRLKPAGGARLVDFFSDSCGSVEVDAEQDGWLGYCGYWLRWSDTVLLSDAVEYFSEQIERSPTAYAYVARSRAWLAEKRNLEQALADAETAVQLDPSFALAWLCRGECRHEAKRHAEAIADCTRALELDPRLHAAQAQRALSRWDAEDFDGAIDDCTVGLERWPHSRDLSNVRAATYCSRGKRHASEQRPQLAERDFTEAIKSDPKNAESFYWRGQSFVQLGDKNAALKDFNRAIELNPRNKFSRIQRASLLYDLDEAEQALADCNAAIELDPRWCGGYALRGFILSVPGKYRESLDDLTRAISLEPNCWPLYGMRSLAWRELGEPAKAIEDLDKVIRDDPTDPLAYRQRAEAWRSMRRFLKSRRDIAEAKRLEAIRTAKRNRDVVR